MVRLPKSHNNQLGLLIYTPIIVILIVAISAISIAIVLNKRSSSGVINSGSRSLINYISSASYGGFVTLPTSYANQVLYVSTDKANLTSSFGITLFDPTAVPDGTIVTVFNSPGSLWPTRISIVWAGTASADSSDSYPSLNVSLGTGQGVTFATQRRIGSHFLVQLEGSTFIPPDFTPDFLQPRDWVVFKYWDPQNQCNAYNNVAAGTTGAIDTNASSPCIGSSNNSGPGSTNDMGPTSNCTSFICNCSNAINPSNIWPPPASAWCNL